MSLSTPWVPPDGGDGRILAQTLRDIADSSDMDELLRYQPDSASARHRAIVAAWLGRVGIDVPPEQVVLTSGGQHAISVILSTFLRPGDTLLTGDLTYPGTKALAQTFGLKIRGVALDEEGIVPEALDLTCEEAPAQALYCIPTLQNPTCVTMSTQRRQDIAEVARKHGLIILEDEVHVGVEGDELPAIATYAPERTLYLATLSKTVTFGLRIGFVAAPSNAVERVRAGVRSTVWMPPPLMAEIATRWLSDGTAVRMGRRQQDELEVRSQMVEKILGSNHEVRTHPRAIHVWLTLPEPWRSDEFVAIAKQRGVLLAGAEAFAVGRKNVPHAVRISISSVPHRAQLQEGLEIIADLLDGCCEPCVDIL
jgi:DNA-binding transcriptional MocR family regulator